MKTFKAVVFDIDGTLTNDVSWTTITEKLGASKEEHESIFKLFLDRSITYEDAKRQLITLWQNTGNANKSFFTESFDTWELKSGAVELTDYLHSKGYILALITGSVDLFASSIANMLHVTDYFANTELVWDDNDMLIDFHYDREQGKKKESHFMQFCQSHNLQPTDCVVVGDSENDLEIFKLTGNGIAVLPAPDELKEVEWKEVTELDHIKELL